MVPVNCMWWHARPMSDQLCRHFGAAVLLSFTSACFLCIQTNPQEARQRIQPWYYFFPIRALAGIQENIMDECLEAWASCRSDGGMYSFESAAVPRNTSARVSPTALLGESLHGTKINDHCGHSVSSPRIRLPRNKPQRTPVKNLAVILNYMRMKR